MKDIKSIVLVSIILLLVVAAGYLIFVIQDGSSPLVLLNSQASEGNGSEPTPTITFQSTSPTPTRSIANPTSINNTITTTMSPSPTPTLADLPETGGGEIIVTATPSPIRKLPVAGFSDWISYMSLGGGALVLLALLL